MGTANYQSGQFTVEKKFANGLQFTANYTRAKIIDEGSAGSIAFTANGEGVPDPSISGCSAAFPIWMSLIF